MGPAPVPAPLPTSGPEYVAFLEQQLAGAVNLLRAKDASEADCVKRVDALYRNAMDELRNTISTQSKAFIARAALMQVDVNRYAYLRSQLVQVRAAGIAATGERLDKVVDRKIDALSKSKQAQSSAAL